MTTDPAADGPVLADLQNLLSKATRATSRALLEREILKRRTGPPPPPPASSEPPKPLKVCTEQVKPSGPAFGSISKYAWDQAKKFVKLYVTIAGVENVPDANITFDVQPTSLRFEVMGLPPPNANLRLAVSPLHSPVDAAQCSWVRKADSMILIKLRKLEEGDEWASVDDSARIKARKKEQEIEQNKGKSTQELLSKMYADADEEGKASLAAAWESGREKREGRKVVT